MLRPWVFFDLDGTLADSVPVLKDVYKDFLAQYGAQGDDHEFEELNGEALKDIVHALRIRHDLSPEEQELKEHYLHLLRQAYRHVIRPMQDADYILRTLGKREHQLMLVTSGPREVAGEFIHAREWDRYFHDCVFGDEVKRAKPAGDIYLSALKRSGAEEQEVTVIEDSANGVQAALAAGLQVIACGDRPGTFFPPGVHTVRNLRELLALQEGRG
jgi:HAD superfamily hydrolase (TIGR01509 family)